MDVICIGKQNRLYIVLIRWLQITLTTFGVMVRPKTTGTHVWLLSNVTFLGCEAICMNPGDEFQHVKRRKGRLE